MKKRILSLGLACLMLAVLTSVAFASSSYKMLYCARCKRNASHVLVSTKPVSCSEALRYTYKCQTCSTTQYVYSGSPLGHIWEEIGRTESTCTTQGEIRYKCTRAGCLRFETLSLLDHTWVETSRTDATCTSAGSAEYVCSMCSGTETESFEALGHDFQETSRENATCTVPGSVNYACSRCTETKTEVIPQLAEDHTWVETSRTDATCTAVGSASYSCSVCSETKTESFEALGHDFQETSRVPATCTVPGSIHYDCSRCAETKTEVIPQLAEDHTWVETSRIDPNCGPGSIEYTCSTCQETRTESILPVITEHSYEAVEFIPATYDDDGDMLTASSVLYSCLDCGDSYTAPVGVSPSGPIVSDGMGGDGMPDATAALGKTFLSGIWALFGIYVPGFSFTFGQMWLGVLLASLSILVVRMIFGFGGGPRGESSRTSSTNNPKISKERRHDEF